MTDAIVLLVQLYLVVVVVDLLLGWVQPDPRRWPRRGFHVLTEPPQRLLRVLLDRLPFGGWDLSPLVLVLLLGAVRVALIRS